MQYLSRSRHTSQLLKHLFRLCLSISFLLPFGLSAKPPIPLEVETKSYDISAIREAVKGGFVDIIDAPLVQQTAEYMEFILTPNGFITNVEYRCIVTFHQGKAGIMIKAVPYDIVNGQRVEVLIFGVRKGVYLIIEGAAQEMDYDIEMDGLLGGLGGF